MQVKPQVVRASLERRTGLRGHLAGELRSVAFLATVLGVGIGCATTQSAGDDATAQSELDAKRAKLRRMKSMKGQEPVATAPVSRDLFASTFTLFFEENENWKDHSFYEDGSYALEPGHVVHLDGGRSQRGLSHVKAVVAGAERYGWILQEDFGTDPPKNATSEASEMLIFGGWSNCMSAGRHDAWACASVHVAAHPEFQKLDRKDKDRAVQSIKPLRQWRLQDADAVVIGIPKEAFAPPPPTPEEVAAKAAEAKAAEKLKQENLTALGKGKCPVGTGWTRMGAGSCYRIIKIELQGAIPYVYAQVISDRHLALDIDVGIQEHGRIKCSDSFGLTELEVGKALSFKHPCPPEEPFGDLGAARGYVRLGKGY